MGKMKIRVWDKKEKKMLYQDKTLITFNNRYCSLEDVLYYHKEDFRVMRYIGKKDINDKELYEGDIIDNGIEIGYIYYDAKKLQYRVKYKEGYTGEITDSDGVVRMKKVGNVHKSSKKLCLTDEELVVPRECLDIN